ncbi:hypothetical protein U0035_08060 [Niabella yanshanensis]|uniref:Uncharacterized protein n=1 Tax=Niabella yanshanensis TaxID=577386 RepID=A0ABZ0W9Y6_9BACT|nr:hypothetical protein [Niabella yanshanensis]WQD40098.1 hypothetical protein U0035_08060 [Niabella yanshanensis]
MGRGFFIKLILVAGMYTAANGQTCITTTASYKGTVGSYPIAMQIQQKRRNDTLNGSYYYLRSGREKAIDLRGLLRHPTLLTERVSVEKNGKYSWETTGRFSIVAPLLATGKLNGNWTNTKTGKQLPVQLELLTVAEDAPVFYDYELVIHQEKIINLSEQEEHRYKTTALKIIQEGRILQTLSGFNEFIGNSPEVELEDLNFDGHLDIKIPISFPDRTKYDGSFLYFIYNASTQKFVRHQQLIDLEYLFFDPVKKEIYRYDQGPEDFVINCYKWRGNEVYLHRTEKEQD